MAEKYCIGVISRDRPRMARQLLQSIHQLALPDNAEVVLFVLDNSSGNALSQVCQEPAIGGGPIKLIYQREPKVGLSTARNAILRYAREAGFDFLAFVDDDEIVPENWLSELIAVQHRTNAHIVGGSVCPVLLEPTKTLVQSLLWRGIQWRTNRKQTGAARQQQAGSDQDITLLTSNILIDLDLVRRTSLEYDTFYDLTGGEDTDFFRRAKILGATSRLATGARVREQVPLQRLTIGYVFTRARDQSVVTFMRKHRDGHSWLYVMTGMVTFYKLFIGLAFTAALPLTLGASLEGSVRGFGSAFGSLLGPLRFRSQHYEKVIGD